MKKGLLIATLTFLTLFGAIIPQNEMAAAKKNNKISITKNITSVLFDSESNDKAIEKKFKKTGKDLLKNKNANQIEINLSFGPIINNIIETKAEGKILIDGKKNHFQASGELYILKIHNKSTIYLGGLHGILNKSNNQSDIIDLSLHYNSKTKEAYIPISIGTYIDENNIPLQLEYGDRFEGMDEAIRDMTQMMSQNEEYIKGEPLFQTMGVRDTELRQTVSGSYSGYNVVYSSLWGQSSVPQNSTYKYYLKIQANKENFANALNDGLTYDVNDPYKIYTTIEHAVVDYWTVARTSTTSIDFNGGTIPETTSSSVNLSLSVPYLSGWAGYTASYFQLTLPVKGVTNTYENNLTRLTTHVWDTYITGILTTNPSPFSEQTGSSTVFNLYNHLPYDSSGTLYGYGSVRFYYTAVQGNGYTLSKWTTASTNEMSQKLTTIQD